MLQQVLQLWNNILEFFKVNLSRLSHVWSNHISRGLLIEWPPGQTYQEEIRILDGVTDYGNLAAQKHQPDAGKQPVATLSHEKYGENALSKVTESCH